METHPTCYPARYFHPSSPKAMVVTASLEGNQIFLQASDNSTRHHFFTSEIFQVIQERGKFIIHIGSLAELHILELSDPAFVDRLQNLLPKPVQVVKTSNAVKKLITGLLGVILLCLLVSYLFLVPWLIRKGSEVFPKETEARIGQQMLHAFLLNQEIDTNATRQINKFYHRLNISSDYQIHITVVRSNVKNAFALPGGEIVVYSEILHHTDSYEALAALLSHETGHIQERHTLKSFLQNFSFSVLLQMLFNDFGNLSGVLVSKASEIQQLSYSREAEEAADDFAYQVLKKNKIDPQGMIQLFEKLKEENNPGNHLPEFLQTHPKLEARIEVIRRRLHSEKSQFIKNDSLEKEWLQLQSP